MFLNSIFQKSDVKARQREEVKALLGEKSCHVLLSKLKSCTIVVCIKYCRTPYFKVNKSFGLVYFSYIKLFYRLKYDCSLSYEKEVKSKAYGPQRPSVLAFNMSRYLSHVATRMTS